MASSTTWIVTTSDQRPISDIARDLTRAGFTTDQVLSDIGSITGSAAPGIAAKLRAIAGVIDVSPDTAIDIGPPDAPLS